ncbi:uncharacterized protein LOC118103835 [Hippoglossus stenolepis]|uniref:uncharacterized protein LOC118103835 n=1 Tax=Hippoglossus stenolepis TaxID=195615 RepID=UPI00159C8B94|nr:uncharacterized protein LOC118103835 [Hippoglossus stenolepis]
MSMDNLENDDALFLADALLDECQENPTEATGVAATSKTGTEKLVWFDEDQEGQPLPKRRRTGEKRKRCSATDPSGSTDPPSTSGQETETETGTIQNIDSLLQEVQNLLGCPTAEPLPSHWKDRQTSTLEKWTLLRPFMVNQMLLSEKPKEGLCQHCRQKTAVVRCHDCLPRPLYCLTCDFAIHRSMVLHNRASMVEGFFRPLPPSTYIKEDEGGTFSYHERECFLPIVLPCCDCSSGKMTVSTRKQVILIGMNGRFNLSLPHGSCSCGKTCSVDIADLVKSGYWPATVNFETLYAVDLFSTFEDLKVAAPGMSRQAFVSMLEHRTKVFGRSGKICGDTMQKAFLEWTYAKFEVEKLSQVQHFQCPACTPSMLAVAVDGNRKLYRFKSQPGPGGFFDGVFLAKDSKVSSFVDYIHGTTKHNPAKGRCGTSQWAAARESANKSASKVDEEGVEVAVCRHGFLLTGLNMFRGEIFAYPLYLQRQLASQNVQFFCSDVVCKYWPYLQRVVRHCPELQDLLTMRPFLSIMHAKAHSWMCELQWGGRNQQGAGTTIGEEVEQVNSFLSRAAICSKYMSKAVRTDILTIQAIGWNKRKAENLDRTLAKRYIKTMQRITEATKDLENINTELSLQEDTVQQWVSDVQQWTTGPTSQNDLQKTIEGLYLSLKQRKFQLYRQSDGNKRRHQLRKKIVVEKKALEDAIIKHNAAVEEADKLPPPNELLANDNYSWQWECHGDMVQKKKVYDKVMLLSRLKEESVIVVREVKQHLEYMRSMVRVMGELSSQLSSQLSEAIGGQGSTEALAETEREGLLCVLKRRLHEVKAHQAAAGRTYQHILGQQTTLDDSSSEEENLESNSSSDEEL